MHAQAFDDVMTFDYWKLKFDLLKNQKTKKGKNLKWKFFVSQVFSFRLTKQASKYVAGTAVKSRFQLALEKLFVGLKIRWSLFYQHLNLVSAIFLSDSYFFTKW